MFPATACLHTMVRSLHYSHPSPLPILDFGGCCRHLASDMGNVQGLAQQWAIVCLCKFEHIMAPHGWSTTSLSSAVRNRYPFTHIVQFISTTVSLLRDRPDKTCFLDSCAWRLSIQALEVGAVPMWMRLRGVRV